jgi:hypothetical protein
MMRASKCSRNVWVSDHASYRDCSQDISGPAPPGSHERHGSREPNACWMRPIFQCRRLHFGRAFAACGASTRYSPRCTSGHRQHSGDHVCAVDSALDPWGKNPARGGRRSGRERYGELWVAPAGSVAACDPVVRGSRSSRANGHPKVVGDLAGQNHRRPSFRAITDLLSTTPKPV